MNRNTIPFGTIAAPMILAVFWTLTECDKSAAATSPDTKNPAAEASLMPWEDPTYKTDIRATMAESRPGPKEKGWTAWLKHHEDRKRWCAEKEVDLLMVGDSIVFGWSRVGKSMWDSYYSDRKAVNIGSSGDRTYHMLDQGNIKTELMPDRLHPNLEGYWAWAEAMEPTISKLLGDAKKSIERPLVSKPVPQAAAKLAERMQKDG